MGKKKGTPEALDYLFERDIIQEEDYISFWRDYWKLTEHGRKELINDYISMASEHADQLNIPIAGVITKNKRDAVKQAKLINGKVVRRDKRGKFSKRGTRYQAVRHSKKRK